MTLSALNLCDLPDDVLLTVASTLSEVEVARMQMVNKRFNELYMAPEVWIDLCKRQFGTAIPAEYEHRPKAGYLYMRNSVGLWTTGRLVLDYEDTDFSATVRAISVAPRGDVLFAVSHDQSAHFVDVHTGRVLQKYTGVGYGWSCDFNGELAISGGGDGHIRGFSCKSADVLWTRAAANQSGSRAIGCRLQADGKVFAVGGADKKVSLWDTATLQALWTTAEIHSGEINTVDITDESVFSGSDDRFVKMLDRRTGAVVKDFAGLNGWVKRVRCDTALNQVLACADDNRLLVWDLRSARTLAEFRSSSWVFDFVCDPGKILAGTQSGKLMVINRRELQLVREIDSVTESHGWACAVGVHQRTLCIGTKSTVRIMHIEPDPTATSSTADA